MKMAVVFTRVTWSKVSHGIKRAGRIMGKRFLEQTFSKIFLQAFAISWADERQLRSRNYVRQSRSLCKR